MRVLVAGATGAIGRRLVPLLAARGYDVVGLTRSTSNARAVREAGATPVVADAAATLIGPPRHAEEPAA